MFKVAYLTTKFDGRNASQKQSNERLEKQAFLKRKQENVVTDQINWHQVKNMTRYKKSTLKRQILSEVKLGRSSVIWKAL